MPDHILGYNCVMCNLIHMYMQQIAKVHYMYVIYSDVPSFLWAAIFQHKVGNTSKVASILQEWQ